MARFVVLMLPVLMLPFGAARGQKVFYTGNLSYSSGSYFFSETTRSFSFTNGLGVRGERLTFSVSIPYIAQTSPWVSNTAIGGLPTGGKEHGKLRDGGGQGGGQGGQGGQGGKAAQNTLSVLAAQMRQSETLDLADTLDYQQQGFSDPSILASYSLIRGSDRFGNRFTMTLNGSLKIPTRRLDDGFSTEALDAGGGTSMSYVFLTGWGLMLDLMVWRLGDLEDLELKDPLSIGFGVTRLLWKSEWMLSASVLSYTQIVEGYDPPRSLYFGAGKKITPRCFYSASLGLGLTESSSDLMLGLGWSIDL